MLDDVRSQIAPDDAALKETRARRDTTRAATKAFDGVRHSFASGSLAHGTANCPIHERDKGLDADTGVVLDRRSHPTLEPDAEEQDGPTPSGEDPTVDLVVGLERADKPGLWIPNTEARVTRLAKAENKRTAVPPLCSFNVEAFGLMFVEQGMDEPSALLALWEEGARALRRRLTPDPAGVSKPIKVLDRPRAIERLEFAAGQLAKALDHDDDEAKVRAALQPLWPDFIAERPGEASKARTAAALRRRSSLGITGTGVLTTSGGTTLAKQPRSFGDGHQPPERCLGERHGGRGPGWRTFRGGPGWRPPPARPTLGSATGGASAPAARSIPISSYRQSPAMRIGGSPWSSTAAPGGLQVSMSMVQAASMPYHTPISEPGTERAVYLAS